MGGACWVCFCCRHSPDYNMNVRIFWVHAKECICVQTTPWFILSFERILGNEIRTNVKCHRKNSLYQRLRGGLNLRRCITQESEPNTLSYSICSTLKRSCLESMVGDINMNSETSIVPLLLSTHQEIRQKYWLHVFSNIYELIWTAFFLIVCGSLPRGSTASHQSELHWHARSQGQETVKTCDRLSTKDNNCKQVL